MRFRRTLAILFAVTTVGLTVFVFSNSLQVAEESQAASDGIVTRILAFFDKSGLEIDRNILSFLVRKLGHFAEYFALGLACTGFIATAMKPKWTVSFSPLYCLVVAICDEFIFQAMTEGRSPQWTDILIDLSGAIIAMTAILIIKNRFQTKH